MNICVVGTGYVGLVTGAVFADLGNDVICVDKDANKIAELVAGRMPIYEPGLEEMVARNMSDGRLAFTTDMASAVRRSVIVFITVGTPPKADGQTDLAAVADVASGIARAMERYTVVVNKSTVPVGTGEFVREVIERHQTRPVPFDVVSNPEFLREGSAIEDTLRPDRIVIGAPTQQVAMSLLELYAPLERPMIITDVPSAEMIKYASNAFLSTKISFANAIANICERAGADVTQVVKGMGMDARIGSAFLSAGLGYGGSCFPKDTSALLGLARQAGSEMRVVAAVIEVNDRQTGVMLEKVREVVPDPRGKVAAVLGLSFKPNTDDIRESPAIKVVEGLKALGFAVRVYDPIAMDNARRELSQVTFCEDEYGTAKGCDLLVLATEWNQFRALDLKRLRGLMKSPVVLDLRNIYEPGDMARLGFTYRCVGRPAVKPT